MNIRIGSLCAFTLISLLSLFAFAAQAGAQNYTFGSLYDFSAGPQDNPCTDGILPATALVQDSSGNLYGTTTYGSTNVNLYCGFLAPGCGTVFELNSAGQETVLYSFCSAPNCTDGTFPNSALIVDAAGNLYGTTSNGGRSSVGNCMGSRFQTGGCGTLFRVDTRGREKVLYNFCSASNCTDGAGPNGLIRDAAGKLYGTTTGGGAYGGGTVFTLDHSNNVSHLTVLYSFCSEPNCVDGSGPGGLLRDTAGNLYGTTYGGGANNNGTVFKLDRSGHDPCSTASVLLQTVPTGAAPTQVWTRTLGAICMGPRVTGVPSTVTASRAARRLSSNLQRNRGAIGPRMCSIVFAPRVVTIARMGSFPTVV